jgi:hypothetical protein
MIGGITILIEGQNMPKCCRNCFAFNGKLRYGCILGAGQKEGNPATVYHKRHKDCPLVEIMIHDVYETGNGIIFRGREVKRP